MPRRDHKDALSTRIQWVDGFERETRDARLASRRDRDYFDGNQWTAEEKRQLKARGQPAVVFNAIQKKINFIRGSEIRTRVDPSAQPRTPAHEDDANIASDAIRYVSDKENVNTIISASHEGILVEGLCGVIVEAESPRGRGAEEDGKTDKDKSKPGREIRIRGITPDRLIWDPASRKPDFSDAMYVGIIVWMDIEDAISHYAGNPHVEKGFRDVLQSTLRNAKAESEVSEDKPSNWAEQNRKRVKIVELFSKKGDDYELCHFTGGGWIIKPRKTGYLNEKKQHECPLLMQSGYISRENRRYGAVRAFISPQDEINKRRSKLLHMISVRQTVREQGTVESSGTMKAQLALPDGDVVVREGALTEGAFTVRENTDIAQGNLQLLENAQQAIDGIGPSLQDSAGDRGVMTGRAVVARQMAATLELEPLKDNLRALTLSIYRAIWHRFRQFKTEEDWVRIRDDGARKGYRFLKINRRITKINRVKELIEEHGVPLEQAFATAQWPEGLGPAQSILQQAQQLAAQAEEQGQPVQPAQLQAMAFQELAKLPEGQEFITENDIPKLDVDIILDVVPDTTIVAEEEFERLATLAKSGQVQIPAEFLIEASQLRNKRELIDRIQQANQTPPEVQQMQEQMQQLQLAMAQVQVQVQQAEVAKKQADTEKAMAQAQEAMAKAQIGVPAEAQKDEGLAMRAAAEAGAVVKGEDSPNTRFD